MLDHMSKTVKLSRSLSLSPDGATSFPVLHCGCIKGDNYGYFLQVDEKRVVAVDVPDGRVMLDILRQQGWTLELLLLTHTHHDHVLHLEDLLKKTGCDFWHPAGATLPVEGTGLRDGEERNVLGLRVQAMETSGHSPLDFSYVFPEVNVCFCGDTLFAWGCGRMFAGPASRFWSSLQRLRELPDETLLCCGHDYREDNRTFALQIFPNSSRWVPEAGEGEMPLHFGEQKRRNPFLSADDPQIAEALGMKGQDPVLVFKKLRELRNQL